MKGKINKVMNKSLDESDSSCSSGISSPSDNCKCNSPGDTVFGKSFSKNWKMTIFIIVLLSGFTVAAHSLLKEGGNVSIQQEPLSSSKIALSPDKTDVSFGTNLASINSLSKMAAEKKADVVFIFLAGDNEESVRTASSQIKTTMNKLLSKGKPVAAFSLKKNAEGYDQLIKDFSVKSLPVVIVAGKGCRPVAISGGEITETKLLNAFVKASVPSSCGPQSKGSDCS